MTTAELRDSVNSLTAADRAMATVQLAKLIAKQSRIGHFSAGDAGLADRCTGGKYERGL